MELSIYFLLFGVLSCYVYGEQSSQNFTSIFSFGDSYTDTGNFPTLAAAAGWPISFTSIYPPYGETFFHQPAGRWSDGRLIIDFIAEEYGLPYIPPYKAYTGSFNQGANFAVGGATAINVEFFEKNGYVKFNMIRDSLDYQLAWFEELKATLCASTEECKEFFSTSLFTFGEFGANDYSFMLEAGVSVNEVRTYVPQVVQLISAAVEQVISAGAVTLAVAGQLPTGCIPIILTLFQSSNSDDYEANTGCLTAYNNLAMYHNVLLRQELMRLRSKYPHVKLSYTNYYDPIINIVKSPCLPGKYCFIDKPLQVCCGKDGPYNYNLTELCGMPGVDACQTPSTYLHWDGVHLTEAAYHYISDTWLHGPFADPPIKAPRN
ncbi:GDSL esterase/lipase [Rhynchospora pubera]|uniref:GDSL esterase/lipase n=1 Tax=Rhynchospora pubera TaxID=906938 RepID=A0AAV8FSG8_9POAL|nr:GDSL esterase/lipase [Rhynchospora pubera]